MAAHIVVRETWAKLLAIFAVVAVSIVLTAVFDLKMGWSAAGEIILFLQMLAFYGLSRIFRGVSEPDEPRRPWRLTEKPALGFVLGALFILFGAGNFLVAYALLNWAQMFAYLATLVLGVLFFISSIKLVTIKKKNPDFYV